MAPQYKFHYFDFCGLGEFIRFLFAYGEIDYDDFRINPADWPTLKLTYPNEKLPLLEFKGEKLNQSTAIGRLLANKVGLAGSDAWEAARIDATVDDLNDLRIKFAECLWIPDPDSKAKAQEKFLKETVPLFFDRLETQVTENGGYFVAGKLSWADLYLAGYSRCILHFFQDIFAKYPGLQGVIDKVHDVPNIKAWIAKRPKSDY